MAHDAYRKLGDLAEAAIKDDRLSEILKSENMAAIQPELDKRGFTAEDIEVLRKGYQALAPRPREEPALPLTFWMW